MKTLTPVLALVIIVSIAGIGSAQAQTGNSYTCIASVATEGGIQVLGTTKVTGNPIAVAASACHDFTRKAFAANTDWSNPDKVCARYPSGTLRTVLALDHFQEVGHTNGYNRVAGFSCLCNGAKNVTQLPTQPIVVQH
jgi:hypothetical protein